MHAVLARTNAELAPFAAVALEMGIRIALPRTACFSTIPDLEALLAALPSNMPPAVALARLEKPNRVARAVLAWALPFYCG